MKKLTLLFFLFSILLVHSQNNPPPTKAQDWNSSRSNKTSKTSSIANPGGNDDENINNQNSSRIPNPNRGNPPSTNAQDWNSSRSNKTSKTSRVSNPTNSTPLKRKDRRIDRRDARKETRRDITVSISSGISTPSSNFKNDGFASNGSFIKFDGAYYFSNFGIGLSVGQTSSLTNENFSSSINTVDIPITNSTQNWKQFYYGIGPEYKTQFGNFSATFSTKIGLQSVKSINLESNYANGATPIAILKIKSDKTSNLSYFSTDLKFGYKISSNFSLYATANYMSALSNGITISKSKIIDTNKNGIIDAQDLKFATGSATIDYETSTQNINPQSINFGIGLSYSFNNPKKAKYAIRDGGKTIGAETNTKVYTLGDAHYGSVTKNNKTLSKADAGNALNALNIEKNDQGYTNKSTMIFVKVDETSLRNSNTKIPKDNLVKENNKRMSKRSLRNRKRYGDKRYRERTKPRTLRSADKRYRERTKPRTLRSADKRYRERTKPRTLRSADKRYRERTKPRTLRSADKRYRERTKARTLRSADKRYRERTKPRTLRSADKRYRERTKARTLRSADKRYRERTKPRTLRSADKRYRERTKARTLRSADKRYRERVKKNTIQNKKPIKTTTKNNKVIPSTDIDTRYLKAQNHQTIQISKSKFQLTAPLLVNKDQAEIINYDWTIKNKTLNKVAKFTGKTINYNFDVSGTYEIEVTPVVNNKILNSYHVNIICN